jgi:hypothetical protein
LVVPVEVLVVLMPALVFLELLALALTAVDLQAQLAQRDHRDLMALVAVVLVVVFRPPALLQQAATAATAS